VGSNAFVLQGLITNGECTGGPTARVKADAFDVFHWGESMDDTQLPLGCNERKIYHRINLSKCAYGCKALAAVEAGTMLPCW